jgi:nucleoside-diphosphate-sugar epimerase
MDVFVTGASGYIGGSVAARLMRAGHRVRGLARSAEKAAALKKLGIAPIDGTLDQADVLTREAKRADAVINAANSDHRGAAEALITGLAGSNKPLIHTSGSSVIADSANGEPSDKVFDEDTSKWTPVPDKQPRADLDRDIVAAASRGVRSIVLCNTLIYGHGLGAHRDSVQVPRLVAKAREGVARHIGRGLNIWSNVHIEDMADLYLLALDKAPAGTFLFVENGETSFRDKTAAIAKALKVKGPEPWPIDEAITAWGKGTAVYAMGSNSRVRAAKARKTLGWAPRHGSVLEWIAKEVKPG